MVRKDWQETAGKWAIVKKGKGKEGKSKSMKPLALLQVNLLILVIGLTTLMGGSNTKAATLTAQANLSQTLPTFNDPAFAPVWNYSDRAVQDGATIGEGGRGYSWGPSVSGSISTTQEIYAGSYRTVQYFDKGRMELGQNASTGQKLVTSGLLVKELVTGFRQFGDQQYIQEPPSQIQVAGDPNSATGTGGANSNAIAPTYASFKGVVTFNPGQNVSNPAVGSVINSRLNRDGSSNVLANPPEQRLLKAYEPATHHNVADVFVDFSNQTGLVWNGNSYVNGPVFSNSNITATGAEATTVTGLSAGAIYVLGLPVTEPYWIQAVVGGVERDVLVQLFERRVLTYTPANPAGSKVEMGNVGQHYYLWRHPATPNTETPPKVLNLVTMAQPTTYTGPCPVTINLSGESKAGGVGPFYWSFYSSIFGPSFILEEEMNLPFLYIEHPFTGSIFVNKSVSGWEELVVYEPEEILSNRASFQVTCT